MDQKDFEGFNLRVLELWCDRAGHLPYSGTDWRSIRELREFVRRGEVPDGILGSSDGAVSGGHVELPAGTLVS